MKRILTVLVAILLALPLIVLACDIQQVESQISNDGYNFVLKQLSISDCLGDQTSDMDNELVSSFNKLTVGKKTAIPLFNATRDALSALAKFADDRAVRGAQIQEWVAMSRELSRSNAILGQINANTSKADAQAISQQALPKKWQRINGDTDGEIDLNGTKVKLLQQINCVAATNCSSYESQRDMVRIFNLVMRLQKYSQDDSLSIQYADAQLQTARWEAYRSQGQHQYIWELWLNGQMMGEDLCPKVEATGIQRGFCKVPESQLIVLHPEAGLRWSNTAQQSSDLKPALIVEVLGYGRWSWGKDQATINDRWGISLVTAYTNEPTGKKLSYGPMLHVGAGYNVSTTRSSDGKWGLLLNLNLADRYFGGAQKVDSYMKCLNKPNAWQLLQGQDSCN